jgi:hypothetical protein
MAEENVSNRIKLQRKIGAISYLVFSLAAYAVTFSLFLPKGPFSYFLLAVLIGILPAPFWFWLFLKNDLQQPEQRKAIFKAFIFGGLAVSITAILNAALGHPFGSSASGLSLALLGMTVLFAALEEFIKYRAATLAAPTTYFYRPINAPILLIAAAIGFAAVENIIFLWRSAFTDGVITTFWLAAIRLVLPTHILASAILGLCIGFAFYQPKEKRRLFFAAGFLAASSLHGLHNYVLLVGMESYALALALFSLMFFLFWLGIIAILRFMKKLRLMPR